MSGNNKRVITTQNFEEKYPNGETLAKQFSVKHVFRAGAIVWCKYKNRDYYLVFKSISRPNRGIQLPGGRIERWENPGQGVVREVKEETGLDVKIVCPLGYGFFQNPDNNFSNLQIYYIVKPSRPINPIKKWFFTDKDATKQRMECWFVPVDKPHDFLAVGQDKVVGMFKNWLDEHKPDESKPKKNSGSVFTKKQ